MMKIHKDKVRTMRRKAQSWLAILIYHRAIGNNHLKVFIQRLKSLCEPVLRSEILQETIKSCIQKTLDEKEATDVKKRIMSRLTPNKFERRMLSLPQIPSETTPVGVKPNLFTLDRLVGVWTVLTDQPSEEFMVRVYPAIDRLYREWYETTGCCGLSDEDCHNHSKESAQFWSGFCRALIRATPQENLSRFIQSGIQTLSNMHQPTGTDWPINELLSQACNLIVQDTAQQIDSALKANPGARDMINIPEFEALVLREESKLGWTNNTDKEALKILRESLSPELAEAVNGKDEIVKSSVEAVGRRGLFNNLLAALDGQLKSKFIKSIIHFLKYIVRVESSWEFDTSNLIEKNARSVQKWLFRR